MGAVMKRQSGIAVVDKQIFFKFRKEDELTSEVLRSSALFHFRVGETLDTELHFLNYWRLKRNIEKLRFSITVYDMQGSRLFIEDDIKILNGANVFSLHSLLRSNLRDNYPVEGSFEFEIHGEENLFVSYPAAVVRYKGPDWHTLAHSTQRIYAESSADSEEIVHSAFRAEEGNQTIHSEPWFEPFFIIHNGPAEFIDEYMEVQIQSINQRIRTFSFPRMNWAPRETKVFWLRDLCDYRNVTGQDIGTYSVKFSVQGVFPRIIAGIEDMRSGAWSIDHTNFAASSGPVAEDVFKTTPDSIDNLVFVMPNMQEEGWNSFADIYPTGLNSKYSVFVNNGVDNVPIRLENKNKRLMHREKLKSEKSVCFSFQSEDGFLPRRFHMGLHYQYEDGAPGFLIDGPLPANTKPVSTRWSPIFTEQGQENFILMSDRKLGNENSKGFTAEVAFYNAKDDEPMCRTFEVSPGGTLTFKVEDDEQLKEFISTGPAWAYMKFQPACYAVVHYISRMTKSVATCHAF
jgi:hypothetical protein